jgi:hypothetical protein
MERCTNHKTPITLLNAFLQAFLMVLLLRQSAPLGNPSGKIILFCIIILMSLLFPFFKRAITFTATNSAYGIIITTLLLTSFFFNCSIGLNWAFSNHEIWPGNQLYPWGLKSDFGYFAPAGYTSIINPYFLIATSITFFSGAVILLSNAKKISKLISISVIVIQLFFLIFLLLSPAPFFEG